MIFCLFLQTACVKNIFRPNENPTKYSHFHSSTGYTKFDLTNKEASTALCSFCKARMNKELSP